MAALFLLSCSIVYTDDYTGKDYIFMSLFYDEISMEALQYGRISIENILLGYDTSYLWMFCPIIVGLPSVKLRKTERFVLFRTNKNQYCLSKYTSILFVSGMIMLWAYLLYMLLCMFLIKDYIWNIILLKKLLSVFCWGILNAIPSVLLSEFIENKYLILCIPFVMNYFMHSFVVNIIPYRVWEYISPYNYQILFLCDNKTAISSISILLFLIVGCGLIKKLIFERRCDCGL